MVQTRHCVEMVDLNLAEVDAMHLVVKHHFRLVQGSIMVSSQMAEPIAAVSSIGISVVTLDVSDRNHSINLDFLDMGVVDGVLKEVGNA